MPALLLRYLGLGGVVLSFGFIGRLVSGALNLSGWQWWALQVGFVLLGALMAWIVFLFLRARDANKPQAVTPSTEDLSATWEEAKDRLASSPRIEHDRIGRIPLLLMVGPRDSAKTTVVMRSGIETELLAGRAQEGDVVTPTQGLNTWYGGGWLFVEASDDVFDDAERWEWTARSLRADRLAAALSGARQAPRAIALCYPCSRLVEMGGGLRTEAQELRSKLATFAETLGINVPVYVLFTKLDQVSNFHDFTRGFTPDEAQELLGATLSRGSGASTEAYAQAEAKQVTAAFDSMIRALALRRTDLLHREASEDVRAGAYEFPRELSKLRNALSEFLVELGRPSQFGVGPFVRGFYFTGVRPIVVDAGPSYAAPAAPAAPEASGATMVFNANATTPSAPTPAAGGSRRVPQWVFLPRLMRGLIFEDRAALAVTESGVRVSGLRRSLLVAGIALTAVVVTGMTTSFLRNRGMERRVVAAAEALPADALSTGASPEAVAQLDSLGTLVATLRDFEQNGAPLSYRWGLYPGNELLGEARRVYFDRFHAVLGADATAALVSSLRQAVAARNPVERESTYQSLKAYLMTHARYDKATESFLPGELYRHWPGAATADSEGEAVAIRQFAYYARELPFGDPLGLTADSTLIESSRSYLREAASDDRIYQAITSSTQASDVRFAGTQRVVSNAHVVPAAYSREGWAEIQEKLGGSLVADEDWVIDAPPPPPENIEQLRASLRSRYALDYIRHWEDFLAAGAVEGIGSIGSAVDVLEVVSDPASPLLGMIGLASHHTAVDSAISAAFAPAHFVVAPEGGAVSEVSQPYLQAVNTLASSMRTVAESEGATREAASIGANTDARRASQAVAQISVGMDGSPAGAAARRHVGRLLEAPIELAMGVLGGLPADELNSAGSQFCRDMASVTRDYPFNPSSRTDADPEDVGIAFGAGSSTLWNFYEENLRGLIAEASGRFRRAAGASPRPSDAFVRYFDRAAQVSRGLFPDEGGDIGVLVSLSIPPPPGIDEIIVESGGQRLRYTDRDRGLETLSWVPDPASSVRVIAVAGSTQVDVLEEQGTWSLFRLFEGAEWSDQGGGAYTVTWNNSQLSQPLSGRIIFAESGPAILRSDLIGNVACVGRIVR